MAKKQYTDYDNTLFGRYIRHIENPDSVGWDPATRTWFASTRKGDDPNNRGMGVDIKYNDAAKAKVEGRSKKELSEQEEHQLRNEHLDYLLGVIDRKKKSIPELANMSPQKEAEVLGILYRGDAKQLWNKNTPLGKALRSDNEEDFHQAVPLFYNSKNLSERARNNDLFWEQQKEPAPTVLPVPIQQPVTERVVAKSEYQPIVEPLDALQPSTFYRSIVENTKEAPAGPYREGYRVPASQERRNNLKKTFESKVAFDKMMKDISVQNNPVPEFVSKSNIEAEGGHLKEKSAWDKLSLADKAEMIGVAVRRGITNLSDIRQKYNEFAEGGSKREGEEVNTDRDYYSTMERVAEENYRNWGFSNPDEALIHALDDNTYNYRGYYDKYPQSEANADTHWTDEFKTVWHPTFSNESIYSGQKSQYNPLGLPGGFWVGNDFVPMAWQVDANRHSIGGPLAEATMEYANGGKIHIKHPGRLTALKKRTGKTEAELYNDGNPAHKKMVVFARNSRKWKHGLGGNLFDGTSQPTQKMNIFRRPSGEYFYQASPESEEVTVVPRIKVSDDPTYWTYADAEGKLYTPKQTATSTQGEVIQTEAPSTWENIIATSNNNYMDPVLGAPARWKASWDNNTNAIRALWDNPAITGHPLGMAAKAVEHLASDEGLSKTIRLYQNSDGSDNARWLWQRSLTGDALTSLGLLPAAAEGYQLGNRALQRGRRFILDVGDRYQGMKDAAAYRSANGDTDTRTIANIKWWENGGTPTGINKMGISNNGDLGIYYIDKSDSEPWFSPTIEKGGNMTLTTHLGGDIPGEYTKDVLPMSKSEMAALAKYLKGVPENTYFGEIGKTKNYAEQYFNIKPSRARAFKDAINNKKEINEPYWNEEEHITDFMEEKDPIQKAYYSHLYEANEPLSTDSYKFILQEAAKDNGRFALRYDSSPMGLFNPQGFYENNFYESLLPLAPEEQVNAINGWMRSYYPKARPAYLENGKVMIPRPLLMLRNKK